MCSSRKKRTDSATEFFLQFGRKERFQLDGQFFIVPEIFLDFSAVIEVVG